MYAHLSRWLQLLIPGKQMKIWPINLYKITYKKNIGYSNHNDLWLVRPDQRCKKLQIPYNNLISKLAPFITALCQHEHAIY